MSLVSSLVIDLQIDEGFEPDIYDDANGQKITKGYTVQGNATFGFGFTSINYADATQILTSKSQAIVTWATENFAWFAALDQVRQRVICNMIYNLGNQGFLEFKNLISCMGNDDYDGAAQAILNSAAAQELPARYQKLAARMQTDG